MVTPLLVSGSGLNRCCSPSGGAGGLSLWLPALASHPRKGHSKMANPGHSGSAGGSEGRNGLKGMALWYSEGCGKRCQRKQGQKPLHSYCICGEPQPPLQALPPNAKSALLLFPTSQRNGCRAGRPLDDALLHEALGARHGKLTGGGGRNSRAGHCQVLSLGPRARAVAVATANEKVK